MNVTAITYPNTTMSEMTGESIKAVLEDVCDNLFNPDPYYQQGGDMVRVGGLTYTCTPHARWDSASAICASTASRSMRAQSYKVAGWAPVAEGATGTPIWEVIEAWLKHKKTIGARKPNRPRLTGVDGDAGVGRCE